MMAEDRKTITELAVIGLGNDILVAAVFHLTDVDDFVCPFQMKSRCARNCSVSFSVKGGS